MLLATVVVAMNEGRCTEKHFRGWLHLPQVILTQEAHVGIVDMELKVIRIPVEGDDLALGIRGHALEQNAPIML